MGKHVKGSLLTYSRGGFSPTSFVAKQYRISSGLLQAVGQGVARTYEPCTEKALPTALARVSSGDISPLAFASHFGELGYFQLARRTLAPSFPAWLPNSQAWTAVNAAFQHYQCVLLGASQNLPEGDPLEWILAQSRTVALCLSFIGVLGPGDEVEMRDEVERIQAHKPYARRDQLFELPAREWRKSLRSGAAPSAIIRRELCQIITDNIAGMHREFVIEPGAIEAESFFLCTTVEAIYWQLADQIETNMVRRCLDCRKFFIARDKRQQYCPLLPGSTGGRCSPKLNGRNARQD